MCLTPIPTQHLTTYALNFHTLQPTTPLTPSPHSSSCFNGRMHFSPWFSWRSVLPCCRKCPSKQKPLPGLPHQQFSKCGLWTSGRASLGSLSDMQSIGLPQTRVGPGDPHLDHLHMILIQAQVQQPLDNQCSFLWEVFGESKFLVVKKVSRAVKLLPVTSLFSQQNMGFGVSRPGFCRLCCLCARQLCRGWFTSLSLSF